MSRIITLLFFLSLFLFADTTMVLSVEKLEKIFQKNCNQKIQTMFGDIKHSKLENICFKYTNQFPEEEKKKLNSLVVEMKKLSAEIKESKKLVPCHL